MQQYGYASPGSLKKSAGRDEALLEWEEALKELQRFLGLEPTGVLDPPTLKLMHKPRCGNADKVNNNNIYV